MTDDGGAVALMDEQLPAPIRPPVDRDEALTPTGRGRWFRRVARVGLGVLAVAAVAAVPVVARQEAAAARREATAARAQADAAAARRAGAEARVEAALDPLAGSYTGAGEATAARDAQRARLVELQLAEDSLEEVVAEARQATEAVEAEQQGLGAEVQQQAVDLPQLEGCLAEVRPLVDAAFLATVFPGTVVPSISPACRSLLTVAEGQG